MPATSRDNRSREEDEEDEEEDEEGEDYYGYYHYDDFFGDENCFSSFIIYKFIIKYTNKIFICLYPGFENMHGFWRDYFQVGREKLKIELE